MNEYVVGQEVTLSGIFKNEEGAPAWPTAATFRLVGRDGVKVEVAGVKDNGVTGRFYAKHVITTGEAGGTTEYRAESSTGLVAAGQREYKVKGDPFA